MFNERARSVALSLTALICWSTTSVTHGMQPFLCAAKKLFQAIEQQNITKIKNIVAWHPAVLRCNHTDATTVCTPLGAAIVTGNLAIIKYLVRKGLSFSYVATNKKTGEDFSAIGFCIAVCAKKEPLLDYFLQMEADLDCGRQDRDKLWSALALAIEQEDLALCKYLCAKGANIEAVFTDYLRSHTALHMAIKTSNIALIDFFIEQGARLDLVHDYYGGCYSEQYTALDSAIRNFARHGASPETMVIIKHLLDAGAATKYRYKNVGCEASVLWTLLLFRNRPHLPLVKLLVQYGAPVTEQRTDRYLHTLALQYGWHTIADYLEAACNYLEQNIICLRWKTDYFHLATLHEKIGDMRDLFATKNGQSMATEDLISLLSAAKHRNAPHGLYELLWLMRPEKKLVRFLEGHNKYLEYCQKSGLCEILRRRTFVDAYFSWKR